MSIEQDAGKDLALDAAEAEQVSGGAKAKKATHKTAHQKIYPVGYIQSPAVTPGQVDDSGTTAWGDDCDDPAV